MTGMEIVREETRRMLRGMIPLAVIVFGVFLLAGADPARSAVSLLLGTCYSLLLFLFHPTIHYCIPVKIFRSVLEILI